MSGLADHGARITGYDVSEARLADIKSGQVDLLPRDHRRLAWHLRRDVLKLTTAGT
jgi:UDP-N-acetyl-D-mannosaminuronate dehydrogenase